MDDKELLERNIRLAFEVVQTAVAQPEAARQLAKVGREGGLVLADPADPEFGLANQQLAEVLRARGEKVSFVQVNKSATVVPARP